MKKILKLFFVFILGISLVSCGARTYDYENANKKADSELSKMERFERMREVLNGETVYGVSEYKTQEIDEIFKHAKGQQRWTGPGHNGDPRKAVKGYQMWAIWYPSFDESGRNTMLDDYNSNRNYMIVIAKEGPYYGNGQTMIVDINGTIYTKFHIALRLE